jgi:pSer/pThr/pTyr-binding forkhead associated (FHA) protein
MALLTLSYADTTGQHAVLLTRDITSIGRLPDQDIVLRDQCVSRQHATIIRENESYSVVDRNSSHGTFLNGVRIQRAPLSPGDLLHLGSLEGPQLRFHCDAPQGTKSAEHQGALAHVLS